MTSLPPSELQAAPRLAYNRAACGLGGNLHQRLDPSHRGDSCRVRQSQGVRLIAMFRRFSSSRFWEWRSGQKNSTQNAHRLF